MSTLVLFSCNSGSQQTEAALNEKETSSPAEGKIYFQCTVNGQPLSDNTDRGIIDPVSQMLLISGENDDYSVGIRIPTNLQPGQNCNNCKGFVHKKINQEGGIKQRKIYEWVENISVELTERKKGYASGQFSFTVKIKENSDEKIIITSGKFGMNISNEENN